MELTDYIEKVKIENNIKYETKDIEKYIVDYVEKQAKGKKYVGISDKDVEDMIKQFTPEDISSSKDTTKEKVNVVSKEKIEESIKNTGMEPLL